MVALIGIAPTPRLFGATNPMLSIELNALGEGAFVPAAYRRDSLVAGAGAFRHADALRWPATGRLAHRFAAVTSTRAIIISACASSSIRVSTFS